jgi:hypothetical protein
MVCDGVCGCVCARVVALLTQGNVQERGRRIASLGAFDRFTLIVGKLILASPRARNMLIVYAIVLHALIIFLLYRLGAAEMSLGEAAEDCAEAFASHMSQFHKAMGADDHGHG